SETAFNMFGALKGTPTAGGTWADLDGSGGTITGDAIDLSAVAPGLYSFEYQVTGTAPCANDVAVLTLNVLNAAPNAGDDASAEACADNSAFDLFASLGGTPDNVGTWNDLVGIGATATGNVIALTSLSAGDYNFEYHMELPDGRDDNALLTITVTEPADPGQDDTVSVYGDAIAFDVFESLQGPPETG